MKKLFTTLSLVLMFALLAINVSFAEENNCTKCDCAKKCNCECHKVIKKCDCKCDDDCNCNCCKEGNCKCEDKNCECVKNNNCQYKQSCDCKKMNKNKKSK